MAEHNGAPVRQPSNSYPSPHSYPSPQMSASYAYPPPQGQSNEPYRQSPTASNMPLPPLNLPPLRAIDGQQQAQQPPPPPQAPQQSGSPLQQAAQHGGYYQPSPQGMPHPQGITSSPQNMMRYPLPQSDQRIMSGGRHKKEIKRRTKTGCLTCRKRRIKCDELHPVCRNCQKSKRDCLGYDPIFKPQQGPQQLQPAPSASPPSSSSTPATASSVPSGYPPAQTGYTPPMSNAYGSAPNGGPQPPPAHQNNAPYEFNSAIDPMLAGAEANAGAAGPPSYGASYSADQNLALQRGLPMKVERRPVRDLRIEDLWFIGDIGPHDSPPVKNEPLPPAKMEEIRSLYVNDFAPGLNGLLETNWYSTVGVDKLLGNPILCQQVAELINLFSQIPGRNDYEADTRCRATETKVVWQLLSMCRSASAPTNGMNGSAASSVNLDEVNKRVDIIEHLLTNRILNQSHMTETQYPADITAEKISEIDFWKALGTFVTRHSDDLNARPDLDGALGQCRNLLGQKENRDVIYSIMVGRHVGARVPEFPEHIRAIQPGGEENDWNKLFIAKQFITDQASYKGTNHPVQRLCDMVIRSWAIRYER